MAMVLASAAATAQPGLQVRVVDAGGAPVADAVISLHATRGSGPVAVATAGEAVIEQVGGEFKPHLLVVTTGTPVRFPNLDRIRHHVYSFSPAKVFELPLYSGEAHEPVTFDVPGVVTLGCNIHDWMLAHVVVLDTPLHVVSDASGMATLAAPPGPWQLQVWHARLPAGDPPFIRDITLHEGNDRADVSLDLAVPVPRRRPGRSAGGRAP